MTLKSLQDPFNPQNVLSHTAHAPSTDDTPAPTLDSHEALMERAVESSVMRAIFGGNDMARRRFLQVVGATAATEIIRSVFPFDTAIAMAQDKVNDIEKRDLSIGFIPITCATPIIMAEPMGFYGSGCEFLQLR